MEKWLKRTIVGVGLLVSMASLAMSSIELLKHIELEKRAEIQKNDALGPSEHTKLYRLVTFDWLDDEQLRSNKRLFWSINAKDCHGCSPIYHLIMHPDVTVDLVKLFIQRGARLDITNNNGSDLYDHAIKYYDAEDLCWYEIKDIRAILNLVHAEILKKKLWTLLNNQYPHKKKLEKRTFYVIR